jgi:hypothetical protein
VGTKLSAVSKSGGDGPTSISAPADTGKSSLVWGPLLAIAAAAFAIEIPFFFLGSPSGHDFEFHLYTWLEVLSQWKHGIFYPRWAALAQFAYGEPRFIFYPPASWTMGAALSTIFPWIIVSSVYIWLVLVAAGSSMFLLARQWLDRRNATFAAVLYAINPYHVLIIYWRSAFAELLASVSLPLLLLLLLRSGEKERRTILLLALVLAGAWLTNAPAAVMIHYSLALLMVVIAWQRRSLRVLLEGSAAVVLGAALAAFYLVPATYEQKWVNISQALSYGVRPVDSFLFTHTDDPDHNHFNYLVSSVAMAEILLTLAVVWSARHWRNRNRELWYCLAAWTAVCAVVMLPITNPLWTILPKLRFMQFPWRWLLALGVPFSLLLVMAFRKWPPRVATYLAMLCVMGWAGHHFQPPWWDRVADLHEMQDIMAMGAGYEGTEEYTPVGATPASLDKDKNARRVTVEGPAHAAIRVTTWSAERKDVNVEMSAPDNLVVRLFNYPSWRAEVNGREVQTSTQPDTGEMLVPVEAGLNRVQIIFMRTWDRKLGGWISLGAVAFWLAATVRKKSPVPTSRRDAR